MTLPKEADALVLFGATGDLAKRKLFPALYHLIAKGAINIPVVGVARSEWDDQELRDHAAAGVREFVKNPDQNASEELCKRITLVTGDYARRETFEALAAHLKELGSGNAVFYLAVPPSIFETVISSLAAVGLNRRGRVVVEKPFGRDLASAQELNRILLEAFPEERIFRIDHYLGKESVEDLLVFRFSNTFLEPIWNRHYVKSVQVTMAEKIGVEGRGSFYDSVGCIRDVVQNHLLQVVALLAMEPPAGPGAKHLSDEKAKVLEQMQTVRRNEVVRGQYEGYLQEEGVAPHSTTETFAALKFRIESFRWAGVPFFVRAGKCLAFNATEAVIELKQPPLLLFDEENSPVPENNLIRFRLGSNDGVTLTVQAKTPGAGLDSEAVDLSVDFAATLGERSEAYERLLYDAIVGESRRFARQDVVEQTWRVIQPTLDHPSHVYKYAKGSWGPAEANRLIESGFWYTPKPPAE